MRRALTEESTLRLLTDHEDGFKAGELAERYGISLSTVWRILADYQAPRTLQPRKKRKPLRAKKRVLKPCGTNAAYARHKARQEYPCTACLEAHAAQQKEWHGKLVSKAAGPSKAL